MREYLFRGKRPNGEWVEGFYADDPQGEGSTIYYYNTHPCEPCLIPFGVIPETVGQYTGLTDKNGKKIFEGDIVLTQEFTDRPYSKKAKRKRHIGMVEYKIKSGHNFYNKETGNYDRFENYSAGYSLNISRDELGSYIYSNWGDFYDCEVVGNIFDNPISAEG